MFWIQVIEHFYSSNCAVNPFFFFFPVQFAGSTEEDEDKEASSHIGHPFEEV